jgi:hypothetical protein
MEKHEGTTSSFSSQLSLLDLHQFVQRKKQEFDRIHLFSAPITTTKYFTLAVYNFIRDSVSYIWNQKKLLYFFLLVLTIFVVLYVTPGEHQEVHLNSPKIVLNY